MYLLPTATYLITTYFLGPDPISPPLRRLPWRPLECTSQISDCSEHNWMRAPATALCNSSLFAPRFCFPWTAPRQWLSMAQILRQAHSWEMPDSSDRWLWEILKQLSKLSLELHWGVRCLHPIFLPSFFHSESDLHCNLMALPVSLFCLPVFSNSHFP